ncbi:MAG: nucleotidyl transferase AbiEii/AbiGii toxin family protein [Planctomycetes bacterium]|nr:nucleotidyl transferase AbiEii/AbiGii toxin family protein [Planctomycetota bacterium]
MKSFGNLPASVRQRLLNRAKSDKRSFNELLQYYAMERFLYRLSKSAHADKFILKGALMLRAWRSPEFRPTMDIDLLGITSNEEGSIVSQIREILAVDVEADGLIFVPESIQTEQITKDADYEGFRIRFRGFLGKTIISMQIDIGFGDTVFPEPVKLCLPAMLDYPAPELLCYSRESTIAEKFEAMVKLGSLNSRMKDFYDIWLLSRQFDFDGPKLAEAIKLTFEHRGTILSIDIEAFNDDFIDNKQILWMAFQKRLHQDHVPTTFRDIAVSVEKFLYPITDALVTNNPIPNIWSAHSQWT